MQDLILKQPWPVGAGFAQIEVTDSQSDQPPFWSDPFFEGLGMRDWDNSTI